MMNVILKDIGKQYNKNWVFNHVNCVFQSGVAYAILGANGSGKSTMLQLIAGNIIPSCGTISYTGNETEYPADSIFSNITFASPYLSLIEELTLVEMIQFHFKFKNCVSGVEPSQISSIMKLENDDHKPLKDFSSGMMQRVRLGLALLSETSLTLLDEPASNLDNEGVAWYQNIVTNYCLKRTIIVCSNHRDEEFAFCKKQLLIENYK